MFDGLILFLCLLVFDVLLHFGCCQGWTSLVVLFLGLGIVDNFCWELEIGWRVIPYLIFLLISWIKVESPLK